MRIYAITRISGDFEGVVLVDKKGTYAGKETVEMSVDLVRIRLDDLTEKVFAVNEILTELVYELAVRRGFSSYSCFM